jgi:peroxin-14
VFEAPPQPLREDYLENAVKFLSHPKVRGSPVVYRRSFLEKKGLTVQEIDEAFRRVPVRSIHPLFLRSHDEQIH